MTPEAWYDVLLVDDDESVTELYAMWLEPTYDITVAHTVGEALDTLNDDFDVVLLDRRLPNCDGTEFLTELRGRGHDLPVVMITAVEPDVDIVELPIEEYLVKPITGDELLDAVELVLRVSSYDDLLQEYYSLTSKRAALRDSSVAADLADYGAYFDLERRLSSLESQLELTRREFDERHYRQLFRGLVG